MYLINEYTFVLIIRYEMVYLPSIYENVYAAKICSRGMSHLFPAGLNWKGASAGVDKHITLMSLCVRTMYLIN